MMEFYEESDSSSNSGKSDFDDEYYELQPLPIPVSKTNKNVIKIKAGQYSEFTVEHDEEPLKEDVEVMDNKNGETKEALQNQTKDIFKNKFGIAQLKSYAGALKSSQRKEDPLEKKHILNLNKKLNYSMELTSYAEILKSQRSKDKISDSKNLNDRQKKTSMKPKCAKNLNSTQICGAVQERLITDLLINNHSSSNFKIAHGVEQKSSNVSTVVARPKPSNTSLSKLNILKFSQCRVEPSFRNQKFRHTVTNRDINFIVSVLFLPYY